MRSNGQRLGYIRTRSGKRTVGSGVLLLSLLLLALSPGSALADVEHFKSFGPDGTEATDFNHVASIALDQQDDLVYVLEETATEAALLKFDAGGNPVAFDGTNPDIEGNRIEGLDLQGPTGFAFANKVAVNSTTGVVYVVQPSSLVAFEPDGDHAEYTAGDGAGTSEIPGISEIRSVAVDSNGSIYAGRGDNTVSIFAATGAPLTSFAATNPRNVGVATNGVVYVIERSGGVNIVKRFTPSSFPVTAGTTYSGATFVTTITPSSFINGLSIDPVNGDVYALESNLGTSWIWRYDAAGNLVESLGAPGTPTESSAFGGASAHIAVWGETKEPAAGETIKLYLNDSEINNPPIRSKVAVVGHNIIIGPPEIANTSVLDVSADSARLRAWVDSNTAETTYHFEYGLEDCAISACTSVPLVDGSVGDGEDPVEVSHLIFGLQPETTYHYRVLAENSFGETVGPSRSFTTQLSSLGFELADDRAWEMVSPPQKFGALIKSPSAAEGGHLQAAADGNALLYNTKNSIEAEPEGNRAIEDSSVLARRDGGGGWRSKDITPPHTTATPIAAGVGREYKLFSPNLERGLLEPTDATPHSPQASERTPYLRESAEPATYTPLVTGKEGFANVPPGTEFGGDPLDFFGEVSVAGATPDLSRVVLRSRVPLTAGAVNNSLYEWEEGQLHPASVLPASEGGATVGAQLGSGAASLRKAISDDGSRVFWSTPSNGLQAFYVRDMGREETVRLDAVQPGATGTGTANPVFQGANAEGTVALFTDSRQLTADANAKGRDLYRCEITLEGGELGCELTNLTAETVGATESAEVQGIASGMSEDATRAYFVAKGVLDSAPNGHGDSAVSGQPNLYLWQRGGGVRFIATLLSEDRTDWGMGGGVFDDKASSLSADASPSGRYLAFMSQGSLTGYDNRDAKSGELAQEVFRYDAAVDELICASCNPSEASPAALRGLDGFVQPGFDPQRLWNGEMLAAVLPEATKTTGLGGPSFYRPRAVHDNGRLFFNAADSLVPADSNGTWDVYQYEPSGTGDCTSSSGGASISPSAGGCVSLISSGTAEEESAFLDASVGGNDVFFYTPAQLSVTDEDQEVDVYDARVNGIPATLTPNAECLGEACQPAARVPDDPTPASASFRGQGDAKPAPRRRCAKGKRAVRRGGKSRCVSRKQKGKAARAKRAAKHGRASR